MLSYWWTGCRITVQRNSQHSVFREYYSLRCGCTLLWIVRLTLRVFASSVVSPLWLCSWADWTDLGMVHHSMAHDQHFDDTHCCDIFCVFVFLYQELATYWCVYFQDSRKICIRPNRKLIIYELYSNTTANKAIKQTEKYHFTQHYWLI